MTRRILEWAAVALFLTAVVAGLYPNAWMSPDAPPTIPKEVLTCLPDHADAGDLAEFCVQLDLSADAVRRGKVYAPTTDFDCPVTFLFPGGVVRALTGWPPVRVVNGFALVSMVLGGLAGYGFSRAVGAAGPVAAVAAAGLVGCNYLAAAHQRAHLHNVQLAWMGLAFWGLAVLCRSVGWRPAVGLGLAMGGQVLSSPSYTLYLSYVGLPAFTLGWWLTRRRQGDVTRAEVLRFAGRVAAAAVLAAAVSAFYLVPRLGYPSASFAPSTMAPWVFDKFVDLFDPAVPLAFVGFPLVVLGVLAINWCVREPRPETVAMTTTLAAAAAMTLPVVAGTPYWVMYHTLPLADRVRVPVRFFPVALLMLLGLVAVHLTACTDGKRPAARWFAAGGLLAALVGGNWLISPWFYAPGGRILGP